MFFTFTTIKIFCYCMKKLLFLLLSVFFIANLNAQNPIQYLFVGTYTDGGSNDGIHVYRFNPNKGEATFVSKTSGVQNPSWLAISKDGKFVYAVNENSGDKPGELSAFAFDKKTGQLTFLNKQPTDGFAPCHVSVDASGKNVITANYAGGNITVFIFRSYCQEITNKENLIPSSPEPSANKPVSEHLS